MDTIHAIGKDLNITLNGVTICYDDFGNSDIPIIFIHGFPFNKSMWTDQMELLKNTHRVIAYDIRGYGKSTPGEDEQSIALFGKPKRKSSFCRRCYYFALSGQASI